MKRCYDLLARLADRLAREWFVITRSWQEESAYLTRWTLLGKRGEGDRAVFLHRFQRSDADELHDHPWPFTSIILLGGYYEITPGPGWRDGVGPTVKHWHGPGTILRRPARWIHRVEIPKGAEAWTIIIRGRKERPWGFWCPVLGWRHWQAHLARSEATGNGCA